MRPSIIHLLLCSAIAGGCSSAPLTIEVKRDDASDVLVRILPCQPPPNDKDCTIAASEDVFLDGTGGSRKVAVNVVSGVGVFSFNGIVCSPLLALSCTKYDIALAQDKVELTLNASSNAGAAVGILFNGTQVITGPACNGMFNQNGTIISELPPGC